MKLSLGFLNPGLICVDRCLVPEECIENGAKHLGPWGDVFRFFSGLGPKGTRTNKDVENSCGKPRKWSTNYYLMVGFHMFSWIFHIFVSLQEGTSWYIMDETCTLYTCRNGDGKTNGEEEMNGLLVSLRWTEISRPCQSEEQRRRTVGCNGLQPIYAWRFQLCVFPFEKKMDEWIRPQLTRMFWDGSTTNQVALKALYLELLPDVKISD